MIAAVEAATAAFSPAFVYRAKGEAEALKGEDNEGLFVGNIEENMVAGDCAEKEEEEEEEEEEEDVGVFGASCPLEARLRAVPSSVSFPRSRSVDSL